MICSPVAAESIISSIEWNTNHGYTIVPGGLHHDVLAYTEQTYQSYWYAFPGESFPAFLDGADYVRTASYDNGYPDLEITLTMASAANLYILMDDDNVTFNDSYYGDWWLRNDGYVDTGVDLTRYPGEHWTLSVWTRQVAAGQVTLGLNCRYGYYSMYGIAATPATIIPEPSTLAALISMGLMGLAIAWRRRRRAA